MPAEAIARVVADLRATRIRCRMDNRGLARIALVGIEDTEVIDATALYTDLVDKDQPVYLYEDHPNIAPPFRFAAVCYTNEHGNVVAMTWQACDHRDGPDDGTLSETAAAFARMGLADGAGRWEPAQAVDWDRVRWTIDTFVWIGGRSTAAGPFPTTGPLHCYRFAVYDDGTPADLHWIHLVREYPQERWDMAHLVLLGALNLLGCSNVVTVEPTRTRAEARRVARTGVRVTEIAVRPLRRHYECLSPGPGGTVPLHTVRGHFAEYGPAYGKGLLFGRIAGRFFIPAHARGSTDAGLVEHSYRLEP